MRFSSEPNISFYTDAQAPLIETIDDIRDLLEIVHEKLASPECENAIKTASSSLYSKPDNDEKALLNTLKKAGNYTEIKQALDEHPIKKGSYVANLLKKSGFSSFVNFSAPQQQQESFFTKK